MSLSSTEPTNAVRPDHEGTQIRLLDLSLPVPEDSEERVRALTYLTESVDHYINEFCDPQDVQGRRVKGALDALVDAARKDDYEGVSLAQATQVFLCFSLCLFL